MRAMRAEGFSGYQDLKLVDIPKPAVSDGRVLVRITAAGVTPLEPTILSGGYHEPKNRRSWVEREPAWWWRKEGKPKAQQARFLGFDEVIDVSVEKLRDGVRRI